MKRTGVLATLTDRQILRLAARNLARYAEDIKRAHSLNGKWVLLDHCDTNAKIEHDIARETARRLRLVAKGGVR